MKSTLRNTKGQGLIEYALIIAVIAIVAIAALTPLGTKIRDAFTGAGTAIDEATGTTTSTGG